MEKKEKIKKGIGLAGIIAITVVFSCIASYAVFGRQPINLEQKITEELWRNGYAVKAVHHEEGQYFDFDVPYWTRTWGVEVPSWYSDNDRWYAFNETIHNLIDDIERHPKYSGDVERMYIWTNDRPKELYVGYIRTRPDGKQFIYAWITDY